MLNSQWQEVITHYCRTHPVETITKRQLYECLCDAQLTTLDEIKKDRQLKESVVGFGLKLIETIAGENERRNESQNPSDDRKGSRPPSRQESREERRPRTSGNESEVETEPRKLTRKRPVPSSTRSSPSVSEKKKMAKQTLKKSTQRLGTIIQQYKIRSVYRKVSKSSPTYQDDLYQAVLDLLVEKGYIKKRSLPTLAEAQRWRQKHDMQEELDGLKLDIERLGARLGPDGLNARRRVAANRTKLLLANERRSSSSESSNSSGFDEPDADKESDAQIESDDEMSDDDEDEPSSQSD
ncbi:hypothetical protein GNI_081520 [Gregarina niphandrodes]|uniref:Uncharacterized protein n=1 Tax=Gregarina niphandrodes TaxID=110365 RepID=A0A023B690_GRENI|nr:hypothetical protein GNI_081520 [Gregarina niphandrodes]EZG65915.1 hypothetical protein GNI_081520 [Gregarina niphandrodes]|eukprot:XP_011134027.1 hypothetical protein GNI_081520 [Gregarina niphandrodes]